MFSGITNTRCEKLKANGLASLATEGLGNPFGGNGQLDEILFFYNDVY